MFRWGGLFICFLTTLSFLTSCIEDSEKQAVKKSPASSQEAKTVFVANPTIHFFLKTFTEGKVTLRKAEAMAERDWSPKDGDKVRMQGADFIFLPADDEMPWIAELAGVESKIIKIEGKAAFPGAGVTDPEYALKVARSTGAALQKNVITGAAGKERIGRFVSLVESRFSPLVETNKKIGNRFQPILFAQSRLKPWIEEIGISASQVDLVPSLPLSGELVGLQLKKSRKNGENWIVWLGEPASELKSTLANRGINSAVLVSVKDESGEVKLLESLRKNLAALEQIHDPQAVAGNGEADRRMSGGNYYQQKIVPFLDKYCIDCHDADTGEGEVEFDLYTNLAKAEMEPDLWESAVELIELGEMPPRKKAQPSAAEKEAFAEWTHELSEKWDSGAMGKDPGRITLRRLNKNEYNYTVRDLFGLKLRPADNFPEETGGEAGFDNNADALFLPPLLMENYVESAGIIVETVYRNPGVRDRYLFIRPTKTEELKPAARKILRLWASRAYRQPVQEAELNRLLSIFQREMKSKNNFAKAMQMPLVAILISPNFIYRAERLMPKKEVYQVSDYNLASRLSYFLWSSMPDGQLFELAQKGELRKPAVIEKQVVRMLQDKRSRSLSMHFGGQWFKWEELRSRANPDAKKFPEFTFDVRVSMYQESSAYFDYLLHNNRSVLELIDSDYAFVNERLASLYGLPAVSGTQIRKVSLTDRNRGGVLGMGSVLTATSLPLRSSPAIRGDWVLTEILGTPPPEPPMNVAQLPEDDRNLEFKTFRETLEAHRKDPSCAGCHKAIDPLGFGLENFDSIGRWRNVQNGAKIDSSGELPDGRKFNSPAELKMILLEEKDQFVKNMTRKVLAYSLGRELTPYDRPVIAEISKKVIADDYRIHRLFLEVSKSYPFLNRRSDTYKPKRLTNP